MNGPFRDFLAGVRAELPILAGVLPFGMIYGALARQVGIPPVAAQSMSFVVFAGSSQFVFAQLVQVGAPGLIILLTVAVVNLRHALYSASVAPYIQKLKPAWKWLLGYLLTDEAFAVAILNYNKPDPSPYKHYYFLGAGLALWGCWQISTAAGVFAGALIPAEWTLDFTLALTFIALLAPVLRERASLAAALAAGLVAVLAFGVPHKLGLMAAALVGITVGVIWETRR
jgi:4-azaleucine resistance transporter AzlC